MKRFFIVSVMVLVGMFLGSGEIKAAACGSGQSCAKELTVRNVYDCALHFSGDYCIEIYYNPVLPCYQSSCIALTDRYTACQGWPVGASTFTSCVLSGHEETHTCCYTPGSTPTPGPSPSTKCTIQGYKGLTPGFQTIEPASSQTVTLGTTSRTSNPYTFTNVNSGNRTVSVSVPEDYSVGYTACTNSTTCHEGEITSGLSWTGNCPAGGYVDLWWHYTPSLPPSCSVSGSTNVIVGDDVSYCVDPSDAPLGAEIWKSPQTSQSWTNVRPKTVGYGCNTTSFNQVGTYYVVCNAYGLVGSQCSGNPWCPWSPVALPEASCSGWVDCTANDVLVVNVISLGPWWQVKDGDVFTGGNISSDIPSTASNPFFNLEGLGGFPGIVNYNGSADFGSGSVSSIGWLVNSPFSIGNKYSTSYFEKQIPADTYINTVSTNLFNNGVIDAGQAEDGIYWFKYDGSSGLDLSIDSDINVGSKKVVLIVNNVDLYINYKIDLTDGQGFFMVMVGKDSEGNKGNIYVDPSVYGSADDIAELKGIYLADGSFYTGEGDGQLHIKGSVAGLDGISLQRDLSDNSSNPAEFIEYDPNQIILFPKILKTKKINWKEVAP